jgi:dipeptidyl aminopeptidase/acylaminoacyl peptidase
MRSAALLLITASLIGTGPAHAQSGPHEPPPLTVPFVMRGPQIYGTAPSELRWSLDGKQLLFKWKQASDAWSAEPDTYAVGRDGRGLHKLGKEEGRLALPLRGAKDRDRRRLVAEVDGDLYLWTAGEAAPRRLTHTTEAERGPAFSRDGSRVLFQRGDNLFALGLKDGALDQLTDIRDKSPDPEKGTASQEWLKGEERALLARVRLAAEQREKEEAQAKAREPRRPFVPAAGWKVADLQAAPGEAWVLARLRKTDPKAQTAVVPFYLNERAYTDPRPSRAKVGDAQPASQLVWLSAATGEARPLETGLLGADGKPRTLQYFAAEWNEVGDSAVLWALSADFKAAWILKLTPGEAKAQVLAEVKDAAWVGGPAAFTLGWVDDATVYFLSEASGWSHLQTVRAVGGPPKALTSGPWEVQGVQLSEDRKTFWLTTNQRHPGEKLLYRLPVQGGTPELVTPAEGWHDALPSPDGSTVADVASFMNRPPELFLQAAKPGAAPQRVTTSPAPDFAARTWMAPSLVEIPASDGVKVPARLYRSSSWRAGGPAVIFVHGAGYLQNAHKGWSSYGREYLFHHLLMEKGYLVLDVDYRGSAGYGRDFRTAIAGHMGGRDLEDEVDAAAWLASVQGADPRRIGMYGGSYGGFMTLMALFTKPGTFKAGAALRPVSDWAHYNHGYTARILGEPQMHPEAYRKSSPIHFAEGLKDRLLICHGLVDTNVHAQDSLRLSQKLIELGKGGWDLVLYPAEDHGFVDPASWTDEYRRILELFESTLK